MGLNGTKVSKWKVLMGPQTQSIRMWCTHKPNKEECTEYSLNKGCSNVTHKLGLIKNGICIDSSIIMWRSWIKVTIKTDQFDLDTGEIAFV